jgi:membrane-bound lytic murein transglycosylase MltF
MDLVVARKEEAARVLVAIAALAAWLFGSTGRPSAPTPIRTSVESGAEGSWSLRVGGWVIRAEGAGAGAPSLDEQTRPLIRIREPQQLSPYDHLIIHHAEAEGLDWRLVAAIISEESDFDPEATSQRGAYGLMQVRPIAAEAVGSRHFKTPSDNIQAGSRYLKQLGDRFGGAHGRDRLALALAAYNMGPGHVRDAQTLAARYGFEANVWRDSMELILPLLENQVIHRQLANGYAQGSTTVSYVNRVLQRYDVYRRDFQAYRAPTTDADQAASASG